MSETHVVEMLCSCDNIERCAVELYISDVRILVAELDTLKEQCNESSQQAD